MHIYNNSSIKVDDCRFSLVKIPYIITSYFVIGIHKFEQNLSFVYSIYLKNKIRSYCRTGIDANTSDIISHVRCFDKKQRQTWSLVASRAGHKTLEIHPGCMHKWNAYMCTGRDAYTRCHENGKNRSALFGERARKIGTKMLTTATCRCLWPRTRMVIRFRPARVTSFRGFAFDAAELSHYKGACAFYSL